MTTTIVKSTRCTNVSNLFHFGMTLCMSRTVFRPSSGVRDRTYSNRHLLNRYCCLLASKQKDRPKRVEYQSRIKQIWYTGASSWFYYNNITMHGPMNVKNSWQPVTLAESDYKELPAHQKLNISQSQLCLINGTVYCYMFRFTWHHHHQAIHTKTFETYQFYKFLHYSGILQFSFKNI